MIMFLPLVLFIAVAVLFMATVGAMAAASIGIALAIINALICLVLFRCALRVPKRHRHIHPTLIWLLMIPVFNMVWDFFVVVALARSYRSHAGGAAPESEDFGMASGLAACACFAFLWLHVLAIPLIGAGIVLTAVYLRHMRRLRRGVARGAPPGVDVIDRPRRLPI